MAITINTGVVRQLNNVNDSGLTLVIFKNARKGSWSNGVFTLGTNKSITRINTLDELKENFGPAVDGGDAGSDITVADWLDAELQEMFVAEYLIRGGVNLLIMTTDVVGTLDSDDLTIADDIDELGYKFVLNPYKFVDESAYADDILIQFIAGTGTYASEAKKDAELYLDISQSMTINGTNLDAVMGLGDSSAKVEFMYGSFSTNYRSEYIPDQTFAGDFVGVPASAAVVVRKNALLIAETPWLPVAGEETGVIPEAVDLANKLTVSNKVLLQSKNINVLHSKIGVGALMVSQNTAFMPAGKTFNTLTVSDKRNPMFRSHVITEALWLKRFFKSNAESIEFQINGPKTWNLWKLGAESKLDLVLRQDGIEEYTVVTGSKVISEQNIQDGLFKGFVSYLPARVIENIELSLLMQESSGVVDIEINGGIL